MDDLSLVSRIAVSGMKAQTTRLRTISENLANVDSIADTKGGEPYRRKVVGFRNELDKALGVKTVGVSRIIEDESEFKKDYDPTHPVANEDGFVLKPNVNPLVELMDMREAQRTYDANLQSISMSKDMKSRTLQLLK